MVMMMMMPGWCTVASTAASTRRACAIYTTQSTQITPGATRLLLLLMQARPGVMWSRQTSVKSQRRRSVH